MRFEGEESEGESEPLIEIWIEGVEGGVRGWGGDVAVGGGAESEIRERGDEGEEGVGREGLVEEFRD